MIKKILFGFMMCVFACPIAWGKGCTLEFKDGTKLLNIQEGRWFDSGDIYIKNTDGSYTDIEPSIEGLVKVNDENVSLKIPDTAFRVVFKCDKWNNGEYFAYYCKYGYDGGNVVDEEKNFRDKCIPTNSAGGATKGNSEKETGKPTMDDDVEENMEEEMTVGEASAILERFFRDAKDNASVWKTTDGKFNTARLASDLTAGVVLGTVGGVVSGHIIKKNQIKKGFEVLHCTVSKQVVADWGDEFNVGLGK